MTAPAPGAGEQTAEVATQDPCFWCRRAQHDSCLSGEVPCRCCATFEVAQ